MGLFGGKGDATGGMKPGFRDFKWGSVPAPHMETLDEHAESKFCWIPNDDLTFAGAAVQKIVYEFWENRFAEVYIEMSPESADRILKDLQAGWGRSSQPNKFIEDFVWQNKAAGPEATTAIFSRNPSTRGATLRILSSYIQMKKTIAKGKPPVR
ncbi:MAG: hypothetical protein NEA02_09600 [Thermoanaerobaculia bacterium]|nr:hypothetical protein [Thermoanaerobaculia bacterium]